MVAVLEIAESFVADLNVVQGQRLDLDLSWNHDGAAVSMTGYRWVSQIRRKAGGESLLDLGPHFTMSSDGKTLALHVPATATRPLERGGVWDLFLIDAQDAGNAFRLVRGTVTLEKAVSADD